MLQVILNTDIAKKFHDFFTTFAETRQVKQGKIR